jgi:hypothetical protein
MSARNRQVRTAPTQGMVTVATAMIDAGYSERKVVRYFADGGVRVNRIDVRKIVAAEHQRQGEASAAAFNAGVERAKAQAAAAAAAAEPKLEVQEWS